MTSLLNRDDETPTEIGSETCEVEQQRRQLFSAKRVVIGLCVALVVAATVTAKQMPVAFRDMTDDAMIDLAEAKKKKKKKKKNPPQTRRMLTGRNTKLHEVRVLRQFWLPMLSEK